MDARRLEDLLSSAFGDPVRVLLAWQDPRSPVPARHPRIHAVIAHDPIRMTGLTDWRDAVELLDPSTTPPTLLTAEELGRWVRRIRRGHGGAWAQATTEPLIGHIHWTRLQAILPPPPPGVTAWWTSAGIDELPHTAMESTALTALAQWMDEVRRG